MYSGLITVCLFFSITTACDGLWLYRCDLCAPRARATSPGSKTPIFLNKLLLARPRNAPGRLSWLHSAAGGHVKLSQGGVSRLASSRIIGVQAAAPHSPRRHPSKRGQAQLLIRRRKNNSTFDWPPSPNACRERFSCCVMRGLYLWRRLRTRHRVPPHDGGNGTILEAKPHQMKDWNVASLAIGAGGMTLWSPWNFRRW